MVAFRELVPEVQSKAVCRTQFIESLNKCNNALSDVAVMSQSYFKRPWAANRLNTAREALKDATTNFAECCPPPMVGMAKMKMLLDRRARTGTGSTSLTPTSSGPPIGAKGDDGAITPSGVTDVPGRTGVTGAMSPSPTPKYKPSSSLLPLSITITPVFSFLISWVLR